MHAELTYLALFAIACAVALAARALRVPFTVALVVAGLGFGSARVLEAPHLTRQLLFAIFLPGLLFEASFHIELREFWANKLAIVGLALPGVLLSIALTTVLLAPVAIALGVGVGFGWGAATVFAALIAATDPIAVVGLFRTLGAPARLRLLVEGESLLNDGTAAVLFTLVLGVVSGAEASPVAAALDFVKVVGLGVLVGAGFGYAVSLVIARVEDPMIEITLTTLLAYGSFIIAEQIHASGVISTVAAGVVCGSFTGRPGTRRTTRIAVESFWEYVAFALNSIVFLLIGFTVPVAALLTSWRPILIAFTAVTVARAIVIAVASGLLRPTRERVPWRWAIVLTWGGLRGALSMVLVLGVGLEFPGRDAMVTMTYGVVVLTILVQGLTMSPLLRWLGLGAASGARNRYDEARGELLGVTAALQLLPSLEHDEAAHIDVLAELRDEYERRAEALRETLRALHRADADLRPAEIAGARRRLLEAEKDRVQQAVRRGLVNESAGGALVRALEARLAALGSPEED